mmetsp:Transcript_43603/g.141516  ORF Transcript_43603/g.141516 Transcript_43603/m.141516 type:complete len:222 (+) Transcript_43603:228-893(+)
MPSSKWTRPRWPSSYATPSVVKVRSTPASWPVTRPPSHSSSVGSSASSTIDEMSGASSASRCAKYVSTCTTLSWRRWRCSASVRWEGAPRLPKRTTARSCFGSSLSSAPSPLSAAYTPWPFASHALRSCARAFICAMRFLRSTSISLSPGPALSRAAASGCPCMCRTPPSAPAASQPWSAPSSRAVSLSSFVSRREVLSIRCEAVQLSSLYMPWKPRCCFT